MIHIMRRRFGALALLLVAALAGAGSAAAAEYRVNRLELANWLPQEGILDIALDGGCSKGGYLPLLGYAQLPVDVTACNTSEGVAEFTFSSGSWKRSFRAQKSVTRNRIIWCEVREEAEGCSGAILYRNRKEPLSVAQKTLTYRECGPHYGSIEFSIATSTRPHQVESWIRSHPVLGQLRVELSGDPILDQQGNQAVDDEGNYVYELRQADFSEAVAMGDRAVEVPVGSELYIVTELRKSGLFSAVDMDRGGCGGADRSYLTTLRSHFFEGGEFSQAKFEAFVRSRLETFLPGSSGYKFRIGNPRFTKVPVPPYPVAMTMQIVAASEVIRGEPGFWDRFYATFEAFENAERGAESYSVAAYVEDYDASKRSSGSDTPPDDSYFNQKVDKFKEAIATTAIMEPLAVNGDCVYGQEGFDPEEDVLKKMKCNGGYGVEQ